MRTHKNGTGCLTPVPSPELAVFASAVSPVLTLVLGLVLFLVLSLILRLVLILVSRPVLLLAIVIGLTLFTVIFAHN